LALSKKIHPMLLTRGVPGTHDIDIMLKFFTDIKKTKFKKVSLPSFNKAVDDRSPQKSWYQINKRPDVIIFEGWCVGAKSEKNIHSKKINQLS
jgi:D-glycerate 3-kinase